MADDMSEYIRSCVTRDRIRCPALYFCPTKIHPAVSAAVFPAWIRMAENHGTCSSSGVWRLNLLLYVHRILYLPAGMAV